MDRKIIDEFMEILKVQEAYEFKIPEGDDITIEEECFWVGVNRGKEHIDYCPSEINNDQWNDLHDFKEKHGFEIEIDGDKSAEMDSFWIRLKR